MNGPKQVIKRLWSDLREPLDHWYSILLLPVGFLFLVLVLDIYTAIPHVGLQELNVLVIGAYVFFTAAQARETRRNRYADNPRTVLPDFETTSTGASEVGIRNFGKGPALNFRLLAVLEHNGERVDSYTISRRSYNLHLSEGEFHSLMEGPLEGLQDASDGIYEDYGQKSIRLYYTWEDISGTGMPRSWDRPNEMEWGEVIEKADGGREIKLAEIREKCT